MKKIELLKSLLEELKDSIDISLLIENVNKDLEIKNFDIHNNNLSIDLKVKNDNPVLTKYNTVMPCVEVDFYKLPSEIRPILEEIGADATPSDPSWVNVYLYATYQLERPANKPSVYFDANKYSDETLQLFKDFYNSVKDFKYIIVKY
ncbi:hypothetical protein CP985_10930 [Malaciobacter mytili LMG 24559]|uniref:DUF2170 domain-containing protein n=1 Tax=Malaciobacter mytili LMG 24559 TaxID=1032238 RepID=A0AAX2AD72_9BACT|nr:hypothetical protein [Malaciobacter mytili]AXH16311.1 hypothetical protein AMYT_a0011 [Malaciobacter mytili LMG 24559]RXK14977.1 hypothetical protein CP985_10930 [Malaciobacter mytili LMG 24559]